MSMHLNRRTVLLLASASAMSLATPLAAQDTALRLAFIPQENPEKLLGDIEAITGWLSEQIGVPVEGFVPGDFLPARVNANALFWVGPAKRRSDTIRIVMGHQTAYAFSA
jgi:ABC-type phosphate/phosphonate transport system, periplasmic component